MTLRTAPPLLLALIALGWPAAAGAADEPRRALRFNPFLLPELSEITPGEAPSGAAVGWAPVLTAALAAGDESLANLGGVILEIGEETHGYTLLAVEVFEASFEKDGATLVLPVTPRDRRDGS